MVLYRYSPKTEEARTAQRFRAAYSRGRRYCRQVQPQQPAPTPAIVMRNPEEYAEFFPSELWFASRVPTGWQLLTRWHHVIGKVLQFVLWGPGPSVKAEAVQADVMPLAKLKVRISGPIALRFYWYS